ncbi:MAG: circularly permuted type 2 ATP-grasp protein, partial [Gallionella sp.]|nr:circularly permuted type 2 ATP-grasp protein [Gallionella sp.]
MKIAYDEMYAADGSVRANYQSYASWLKGVPDDVIVRKRKAAEIAFHQTGITFAVYGESSSKERLIPFDIVPRIIPAEEWVRMEAGLRQRVKALNAFLHDIYHGQEILKAGVIPAQQVLGNSQYCHAMRGVDVPEQIYAHIAGVDLVRAESSNGDAQYYVLEDNLRTPSGVSYMLENRKMMMRLFPDLFSRQKIAAVEHYPDLLLNSLRSVAPQSVTDPNVVVLTPGQYNSAYFEHAFLAQQMGIELVDGNDLFVKNDIVYMRTTKGPIRVDVIYRRIDDDFLDPKVFNKDSMLGVPGLFAAYCAGSVTLANAVGTGIADDKAIYVHVPDMIRFYCGEEPILSNVPTWELGKPKDLAYVLEHLSELVVKEVHGSGGYGMLVGPTSSKAEIEAFRSKIIASPAGYIAQPTLALSTCPTYVESGVAPRHIDLRPYV